MARLRLPPNEDHRQKLRAGKELCPGCSHELSQHNIKFASAIRKNYYCINPLCQWYKHEMVIIRQQGNQTHRDVMITGEDIPVALIPHPTHGRGQQRNPPPSGPTLREQFGGKSSGRKATGSGSSSGPTVVIHNNFGDGATGGGPRKPKGKNTAREAKRAALEQEAIKLAKTLGDVPTVQQLMNALEIQTDTAFRLNKLLLQMEQDGTLNFQEAIPKKEAEGDPLDEQLDEDAHEAPSQKKGLPIVQIVVAVVAIALMAYAIYTSGGINILGNQTETEVPAGESAVGAQAGSIVPEVIACSWDYKGYNGNPTTGMLVEVLQKDLGLGDPATPENLNPNSDSRKKIMLVWATINSQQVVNPKTGTTTSLAELNSEAPITVRIPIAILQAVGITQCPATTTSISSGK